MNKAQYIAIDNHVRGFSLWDVIDTLSKNKISKSDFYFLKSLEVLPGSIYKFWWSDGFETLIISRFVMKRGSCHVSVYTNFGAETAFDSLTDSDVIATQFGTLHMKSPSQFASLDAYAQAYALSLI